MPELMKVRMQKALLAVCTVAIAASLLPGCELLDQQKVRRPRATARQAGPTDNQKMRLDEAAQATDSGDYERALEVFRSILAENPTITTAYLGIGEIYILQEDYEHAEPVYARAAKLEPRNFDAQYGHGLALQMLGKFVDAVKAYHRALTIDPTNQDANLNIATTYLQLGEARSALVFAEKAVELNPNNGSARVNLGAIYEQLGRNRDAIDQYIFALEIIEDDPAPVMLNLVNVLAKENLYQDTVNAAENLIKLQPSANAYERLGWAYFRLANYDKSIEAYRNGVRRDPSHWPSLNGVGINALNVWLISKKADPSSWQEARDSFRQSLRLNREQPRLLALMSNYNMQ